MSNPNQTCPKTCGKLSTAAVFICVGVIQLLAGIILLKSEYVYLLAGIDFITAVSNMFIGGSLGVSSSVWEKKQSRLAFKNTARRNVLAGCYISVMAVNTTTAIIMILGDGHKLLTVTGDVNPSDAASFIIEILACSYVVSVCAPIVCIVVALVCLAGTRVQFYENTKSAELMSKMASSEWVYDRSTKAKLSEVLSSPPCTSPASEDNVFMDKKTASGTKALINKRYLKKSSYTSSLPSISEIQGSLEYLNQKRQRILDEIKSGRPVFFADDYLQFPEFKYSSHANLQSPPFTSSQSSGRLLSNESKFIKLRQSDFMGNKDARQLNFKENTINELKNKFSENSENFECRRKYPSVPERLPQYSDSSLEENSRSYRGRDERNVLSESSDSACYQSCEGLSSATVMSPRIQESNTSISSERYSYPEFDRETPMADSENCQEDCVFELKDLNRRETLAHSKSVKLEKPPHRCKRSFSTLHSELKRDIAQRITSMGSIAESPSEESSDASSDQTEASVSNSEPNLKDKLSILANRPPSSTNLLKKLWSVNGCEDREKLSGILVDADSLVGLSDEELMARTNRIRILRKSVQVRAKNNGMSDSADL